MSETQDIETLALDAAIALSMEGMGTLLSRLPEAGGPAGVVLEGEPAMSMILTDDERPITCACSLRPDWAVQYREDGG